MIELTFGGRPTRLLRRRASSLKGSTVQVLADILFDCDFDRIHCSRSLLRAQEDRPEPLDLCYRSIVGKASDNGMRWRSL